MSNFLIRTAFAATIFCATAALAEDPAKPAETAKGQALVDAQGYSLYTFDKDADGKSACNGPCAAFWPPLKADAGSAASGDWTVIARDDGSAQWAYKGKPLYTFKKDEKPGDADGDDFKQVWHIAKP